MFYDLHTHTRLLPVFLSWQDEGEQQQDEGEQQQDEGEAMVEGKQQDGEGHGASGEALLPTERVLFSCSGP